MAILFGISMRISAENFRVYLATPDFGDAKAIRDNADNPAIALNSPGIPSPYSIENALQFIDFAKHKHASGEEFHTCIRLLNGNILGLCALANIESANAQAEIGYILGMEHWGKGYAKEAVELIIGFGFLRLNLSTICAKVPVYNGRSIRLLRSLGFRKSGAIKESSMHDGGLVEEFLFSMHKENYRDGIDITIEGY